MRILALAALPAGGSDAELELVGSWTGMDRYRERRDALVTTFDLGAHVHFAGAVSDEALAQAYARANVFMCLSEHDRFCAPLL